LSTVYFRFATPGSATLQRAAVLERLIARADAATRVGDWRTEAFRVVAPPNAPMPSVAAAACRASSVATPGAWVCMAAPVHLVAGMSNVTLSTDGLLRVTKTEADLLAADFNRVFGGAGVQLVRGHTATLLCVFDRPQDVVTRDPEDVVGQDVFGYQASGASAPRLRGLMSEMEMWFYDHEVNRARTASALPVITGLWLWGGGAPIPVLPIIDGWTAGEDPLFAALGDQQEFPRPATSRRAGARSAAGVIVTADHPGSRTWPEVERRWLAPAVAALRTGLIQRLELSSGNRRFGVGRGHALRFWRRAKPWWASFGMHGSAPADGARFEGEPGGSGEGERFEGEPGGSREGELFEGETREGEPLTRQPMKSNGNH
jgi:hypothetical protein